MTEVMFYSILMIVVGIFNLSITIRFFVSKTFGEEYIRKSPKAWLWRKIFGEEKAYQMTKKIFAPLGMIMSICFIAFGIYLLIISST